MKIATSLIWVILLLVVGCTKRVSVVDTSPAVVMDLSLVEVPVINEPVQDPAMAVVDTFSPPLPVYFEYNSHEVKYDQLDRVHKVRNYVKTHGDEMYELVGNCDERGSDGFNYRLGLDRASAVKTMVGSPDIVIKSNGRNKLVNINCISESCHAENRRVELIITPRKGKTYE